MDFDALFGEDVLGAAAVAKPESDEDLKAVPLRTRLRDFYEWGDIATLASPATPSVDKVNEKTWPIVYGPTDAEPTRPIPAWHNELAVYNYNAVKTAAVALCRTDIYVRWKSEHYKANNCTEETRPPSVVIPIETNAIQGANVKLVGSLANINLMPGARLAGGAADAVVTANPAFKGDVSTFQAACPALYSGGVYLGKALLGGINKMLAGQPALNNLVAPLFNLRILVAKGIRPAAPVVMPDGFSHYDLGTMPGFLRHSVYANNQRAADSAIVANALHRALFEGQVVALCGSYSCIPRLQPRKPTTIYTPYEMPHETTVIQRTYVDKAEAVREANIVVDPDVSLFQLEWPKATMVAVALGASPDWFQFGSKGSRFSGFVTLGSTPRLWVTVDPKGVYSARDLPNLYTAASGLVAHLVLCNIQRALNSEPDIWLMDTATMKGFNTNAVEFNVWTKKVHLTSVKGAAKRLVFKMGQHGDKMPAAPTVEFCPGCDKAAAGAIKKRKDPRTDKILSYHMDCYNRLFPPTGVDKMDGAGKATSGGTRKDGPPSKKPKASA